MRIAVVSKHIYPPVGGAEISMLEISKRFATEHDVYILSQDTDVKQPPGAVEMQYIEKGWLSSFLKGRWIQKNFDYLKWRLVIRRVLSTRKVDLVFTQLGYSAPTIFASKDLQIPSVLFIRSFEYFCLLDYESRLKCNGRCPYCLKGWKERLQIPFARKIYKMRCQAFMAATRVVANSQFMAQKCKEYFGREVDVVYPFGWGEATSSVPLGKYNKNFITMITPTLHKGVNIFLEIAKRMPEQNFRAIGRTNDSIIAQLNSLSNVTYVPWTDKKEIFYQSSILLVPSLCEEAFGRVCVEAMANEVPCIASNRGGILEAVGDAGIIINDPNNIDLWTNAINEVLSNKILRNQMVKKGKKIITQFDGQRSLAKLKRIIDEIV